MRTLVIVSPLTRHMNEILASHLSVGETYFFREKQSLEILGSRFFNCCNHAARMSGVFVSGVRAAARARKPIPSRYC